MGRNIKALQGAVKAQEKTINVQSKMLDEIQILHTTMKNLLDSTNEKSMIERLEAYKKFVEEEKSAAVTRLHQQYGKVTDVIFRVIYGSTLTLIPYIPPPRRNDAINAINSSMIRDSLSQLINNMPDLSTNFVPSLAELLLSHSRPNDK